jgi:oligosaccharide repeat unit polymerase
MFEQLLWLTAGGLVASVGIAYLRTKDPLHPLMYLGPMLFYIYAMIPLTLYYRDLLSHHFSDESDLLFAQAVVASGLLCFCLGCLRNNVSSAHIHARRLDLNFSPPVRRKLMVLSYVLAAVGIGVFLYIMARSGGIMEVYSTPKGGGRAESGYVSSAPLLTIPAMILYLLAQQGRKMNGKTAGLMILFISPHIIHGFLAASRGTTFLALGALVFGWYLTSPRRPSVRTLIAAIVGIGLLMIFLKSQRREIYIGSDFEFNQERFQETLVPTDRDSADNYAYTWGLILMSRHYNMHYWGKRYAVQLFVRPIPKQFWPTKYEDTGMANMVTMPGGGGFSMGQWFSALGWLPNAGSATGFVADAFLEFSWGGLVVCYLIGFLYSYLWKQSILRKGIWTVVYFEACVVSVFLPTQGLSTAWAYRFIYLAVPTVLIWRFAISSMAGRVRRIPLMRRLSPSPEGPPRQSPSPNPAPRP